MDIKPAKLDGGSELKYLYLVERLPAVNQKEALLDWLTSRNRDYLEVDEQYKGADALTVTGTENEIQAISSRYALDIQFTKSVNLDIIHPSNPNFDVDRPVYGVVPSKNQNNIALLIKISDSNHVVPFHTGDKLYLHPGMIENYSGKEPILTDVGKLLMNQLLLVYPFGSLIPYKNERFDPGKLDDEVAQLILDKKVTRKMYNTYMENGYWYCSDGSLSVSTLSPKALTTDPQVAIRKQQLLEQYKDKLDDPVVLAKIEKELIALDKAWLNNDDSAPFFAVEGGKAWKEQRKKMYLMVGMATAFDKNTGKYEFVPESLEDGWRPEHIDVMANDIRRGSYGRGIETAKGGEQTKFILRIFQDVTITEDDCGTKRGAKLVLTKDNYTEFLDRYLVDGTLLSAENAPNYFGKEILLRSPMYCRSSPGFCYKCCGEIFKRMDMKAIGLQAISVTSNFTSLSMKSMHSSSIASTTVKNFARFLRNKQA